MTKKEDDHLIRLAGVEETPHPWLRRFLKPIKEFCKHASFMVAIFFAFLLVSLGLSRSRK